MARIVVAGDSLIDRIAGVDGRIRAVPGGGALNTARTIARLGGDVAFVSQLSSDEAGRSIRDALLRDGVDLRWAPRTDQPTTMATATVDAQGNATYVFELDGTASATLTPADALASLEPAPAALHVGTLGLVVEPIATTLAGAVAGIGETTLLMVDPNCRPDTIIDRPTYLARMTAILRRADVIKLSGEDLAYLAPDRSRAASLGDLLDLGARLIIVTDGPEAVRILTPAGQRVMPVPTVPIVDTVGAGDAFGGGFLADWIERGLGRAELDDIEAVEETVRFAVAVAGLTVGRAGADPPTRAEVERATAIP